MKHSEWFEVEQEVRQGCTLSPWLFNVLMFAIVDEAREGFREGVRLEEKNVNILLFAYDMVLVADSEESLRVNLTKLNEALTKRKKTEVITMGKDRGHCCVKVWDRKLEAAGVVKYLGVMICGDGNMEKIRSRI